MELEQTPEIAYLIFCRYTGTATEEEEKELEHWLAADERNRQFMENLVRQNFFTRRQQEENLYDTMVAFQRVQKKYHRQRRPIWRRGMWGSVAAVLLLFIGGISFLYFFRQQDVKPEVEWVDLVDFSAGESKAILTLADGQRVELGQNAADSTVGHMADKLRISLDELEYRDAGDITVLEYNVLEIPRKGEFKLLLADGTRVWLNSDSRIKYPIKFGNVERRVYLEGEAYFEVAENKLVPFIVDMGKASLQVLGTSFNARAYKEEPGIYATLTRGKIQLNAGKQSLILQPEEQGIANVLTGELIRKKVDSRLYTAWREGRFIFQEQTLEDIMTTLSRWYDVQIFFTSTSARNITFSGNLKRYDRFDKIIEMLEMTGVAHFEVKGNAILISE